MKKTTDKHLKPISLIVLILTFLPCFTASANENRLNYLLQQLDNIQAEHNIPAYAVVLTSADKILLEQVRGISHAGSTKPVSQQGYFRIGSITKTFVALSALATQQQGKLKLSDKATKYLEPDLFNNGYNKTQPITLAQLLEHSAGFTDMGRKEFASNDEVTLSEGLKRFAKKREVKWQPGLFHSYSNTSYGLAGRVIEVATGTCQWTGRLENRFGGVCRCVLFCRWPLQIRHKATRFAIEMAQWTITLQSVRSGLGSAGTHWQWSVQANI